MMATEWDADTVLRVRALRVKAGEKYGDPCDMSVGEYPDGKWWCRSLNEKRFGAAPFVVADSLAELEARVDAA